MLGGMRRTSGHRFVKVMRWAAAALMLGVVAAMPGSIPGDVVPIAAVSGDVDDGPAELYAGLDVRDDIGLEEVTVEREPATRPVGQVIWTTSSQESVESTSAVIDRLGTSGIPEVALRAYLRSQETTSVSDPSCGIPWSLLAAIGRVESNHGRYGGAKLRDDGYGTRLIRGIPLDGRPGVALIRDSDDGALDGDPVYDRAVGPMQFIPSSWRAVAADGNADGRRDPDNIFDATVGSATYLCAGSGNLRDRSQRAQAVFRYNHSQEYVNVVMSLADAYERGQVTPLPHEEPAPRPPVLPTPPGPPANHGPPPGLDPDPTPPPTTPPPTKPPTRPPTRPPGQPGPVCPTTTSTSSTTTTSTTAPTTTTTVPPGCPTTTTSATTTSTSTTTTAPATTATEAPGTSGPASSTSTIG